MLLFEDVVKVIDCSVICGARTVEEELANIASGHSKLTDPYASKHVIGPARPQSLAAEVAPFPVIWPDPAVHRSRSQYAHAIGRFYRFAGFVEARALALGITIRWGGDWDGDGDLFDQTFDDLAHFELVA